MCSEINADSKFDEAKVKLLTGGDVLSGRYMRQDFFDFVPAHTLFLMGNHQPQVQAGGTSFWRRLRLILAWIVEGARQVLTDGRHTPDSVNAATADYSDDTKSGVERFLDEVCTTGGTDTARAKAV